MIKGLAFDPGGTLVDVESIHYWAHLVAARDAGLVISLEEAISRIPHFVGGPDESVAKEIAALGANRSAEFILARKRAEFGILLKETPILPRSGVIDMICWLLRSGFYLPQTIGTVDSRTQARLLLGKSGLDGFFHGDNIVCKEDVKELKPAPDVWIETARRMNIKPREQLVFEDSPSGVISAKVSGSIVVGMPAHNYPTIIQRLMDAGAVRVFMDWREINFAALIANLNEILSQGE